MCAQAASSVAAPLVQPGRWQRFVASHPEWWALVLSGAAWSTLVWRAGFGTNGGGAAHVHEHAEVVNGSPGIASFLAHDGLTWLLMVGAMMLPMAVAPLRLTAARSIWRRRDRAIAWFLAGYTGLWLVTGLAASAVLQLGGIDSWPQPAIGGAGLLLAAVWQTTPAKQRALLACHRTFPVTPSGWRADLDCLRVGWMIGQRCFLSCWALMLACFLTLHSLPAMAVLTAVGVVERTVVRPDQRVIVSGTLALALAFVLSPSWSI